MKKLDLVLAWALVVLGFIQYGSALGVLHAVGIEFSWSLGGGTAMVAAGFLNVIRNDRGRGLVRTASVLSNILLLVSIGAVLISLSRSSHLSHYAHVIVPLLLVIPETLFSILQ